MRISDWSSDVCSSDLIAHAAGLPLMLDCTFATPYLFKGFEHGADLVLHSATKFLAGHGVAIGGALIDSGRFEWEKSGKFPPLTDHFAGYHGIDFADELRPHAFIIRTLHGALPAFVPRLSSPN